MNELQRFIANSRHYAWKELNHFAPLGAVLIGPISKESVEALEPDITDVKYHSILNWRAVNNATWVSQRVSHLAKELGKSGIKCSSVPSIRRCSVPGVIGLVSIISTDPVFTCLGNSAKLHNTNGKHWKFNIGHMCQVVTS